jgi:hypothetical protein
MKVVTFESISPQSGNTDTDITRTYELPSGRLLSSESVDSPSFGGTDGRRWRPGSCATGVSLSWTACRWVCGGMMRCTSRPRARCVWRASRTGSSFGMGSSGVGGWREVRAQVGQAGRLTERFFGRAARERDRRPPRGARAGRALRGSGPAYQWAAGPLQVKPRHPQEKSDGR